MNQGERGANMGTMLPKIATDYVQSINGRLSGAFNAVFADAAVVNDNGREFRGADAIKSWSDREIFDVQVTFDVLDVVERDSEIIVTAKVDGNFDRTGLPDPVVIDNCIKAERGKIVQLTCRLNNQGPQA